MHLFIHSIVENWIKTNRFEALEMSILNQVFMIVTLTGPVTVLFGGNDKVLELVAAFVNVLLLQSHLLGLLQFQTAIIASDNSCYGELSRDGLAVLVLIKIYLPTNFRLQPS
jgi:hypothetical protein